MKKKIVVFLVVGVLVLGLGISLAYFTPIITGNGKEISLVAKELKVIYTDTSQINTSIIEPGWHVNKTFSVQNKSDGVYKYDIVIKDLINTFVTENYLQYKITSDNNGYSCDWTNVPKSEQQLDTVLAHSVSINDKEIQNYIVEFRYSETEEDQSEDMGKSFGGSIMIQEGTKDIPKFTAKLLEDNKDIKTRDDFSKPFSELGIEAGLYKESGNFTEDMDGDGNGEDVYYFVGDVTNNWVVFGGFWWRIIRTNEDGSVRLLYAGKATKQGDTYTGHDAQEGIAEVGSSKLTSVQYNSTSSNTMYVGYMYGSSGSLVSNRLNSNPSTIKGRVDAWYDEHMIKTDDQKHPYGSYLSRTAVYCNDRATSSYSTRAMNYAAYYRLDSNKRPSFKCGVDQSGTLYSGGGAADNADKFTATNLSDVGNEALGDKPVGLMTADEVAYAGGKYGTNNSSAWYYQNSKGDSVTGATDWWTMSPSYVDYSGGARVFIVFGSSHPGYLSYGSVYASGGVRPVVSLKSCVSVSGKGTTDDPYIPVEISNECANADN